MTQRQHDTRKAMTETPLPPEPPAAKTPAEPRHVSREVGKAETHLIRLKRLKAKSLEHHAIVWDEKRVAFIDSLPGDVKKMLVAGGVITAQEVEDAGAQ